MILLITGKVPKVPKVGRADSSVALTVGCPSPALW